MTKQDLIERVVIETKVGKQQATAVIESVMANIKHSVTRGESVYLRGFGTFKPKARKEKAARDINKGTIVIIPERSVPSFIPAGEFRNQVIEASTKLEEIEQ